MSKSLSDAAGLYRIAGEVTFDRTVVNDTELRGFSLGLRNFIFRLGDDREDSFWRPIVARLRRVRWEFATVPLPLSHPDLGLAESAEYVSAKLRGCERVFPEHAKAARTLTAQLAMLARRHSDRLGESVRALCSQSGPGAIVLLRERHVRAVEHHLAAETGDAVIVASELDGSIETFEWAIAVGPSSWFPRQVFAAPKARRVSVVQFDWLRDPVLEPAIFISPAGGARSSLAGLPAYSGTQSGGGSMEPHELVPLTDWPAIASSTGAISAEVEERGDAIDAYLLVLASDQAIYLEAEEGSRAYVVEVTEGKELHQVPTRSIEPGRCLVTRVGGEGDYVGEIADALLGDEAERLRREQLQWTEALRALIEAEGLSAVCRQLRAAGSGRASPANVRRWASEKSIRTASFDDFLAIMRVGGLEAEADSLWSDMGMIDQAHLRAGQRVRTLLNREIQQGDTRQLERRGWQDYEIEEIEGEGALRVARVEARATNPVRISRRRARRLIAVERDLWQG
jgi:CRP-like cAMP-binding protein